MVPVQQSSVYPIIQSGNQSINGDCRQGAKPLDNNEIDYAHITCLSDNIDSRCKKGWKSVSQIFYVPTSCPHIRLHKCATIWHPTMHTELHAGFWEARIDTRGWSYRKLHIPRSSRTIVSNTARGQDQPEVKTNEAATTHNQKPRPARSKPQPRGNKTQPKAKTAQK